MRGRRARDRMVVGFTTTCVISLNPVHGEVYSIHYVIKFVSDLWQIGGFLQVIIPDITFRLIKLDDHDVIVVVITELQIKKKSCQTLGPASKRVLPDLSTVCQTYLFLEIF